MNLDPSQNLILSLFRRQVNVKKVSSSSIIRKTPLGPYKGMTDVIFLWWFLNLDPSQNLIISLFRRQVSVKKVSSPLIIRKTPLGPYKCMTHVIFL